MKKKTIVYKIRVFPTISETFIILNIVEAIKAGFDVQIIPDIIQKDFLGSQPHLLEKYDLKNKLYCYSSPKNKILRIKGALSYLLNVRLCYYFIKYCIFKKRISLEYIYTLNFYERFKKDAIFHVHFANREKPLFDLKKIGFLKSKIIITAHGFDIHNITQDEASDINKLVSNVTVNTRYLKCQSIDNGIDTDLIEVVPVGIDTSLFKFKYIKTLNKNYKNIDLVIFSVGRLIPLKGHIYGIMAVESLVNKGYNLKYKIVGHGEEREALLNYVKEAGLQETILIDDFLGQTELHNEFKKADIFLFPSTSDKTGRREAFGLVSLEAQAMGLPVIGFRSGGFPETIVEGQTGFAVEDKNVEALADRIEAFILNRELLIKMSKNGPKHINEKFSIESTTGQYLKLYI